MVVLSLFVEGGGDTNKLAIDCKRGFRIFLEKSGLKGKMPRIVAGGTRAQAYDKFCTALKTGQRALLLVDSEAAVSEISPWTHLRNRPGDGWEKPGTAADDDCHLMVQCMEHWFLADRETLKAFYGQGYRESALPSSGTSLESIPKDTLSRSLYEATRNSRTKRAYSKGGHSFELLARIDPAKVTAASLWADRFVTAVRTAMTVP
jgi:hypothetical protein